MIDVHAHILPQRYVAFLEENGVSPAPKNRQAKYALAPWTNAPDDVIERLRLMDQAGVRQQVLSPHFAPYLKDEALSSEAARIVNEELAQVVADSPGRLMAYASLPLPYIEASLSEIAYALDELGMRGVALLCFCGDLSIADPLFDPIYAELDRRGATLFLHPCQNGLCSKFLQDWKLTNSLGPTLEDMVAAVHLIIAQVPQRFPNLKIIVPHLGGGLPMLVGRLDNQLGLSVPLDEPPSASLRRLYYDCCCHGSVSALRTAVAEIGADRILLGTDYPMLTLHETYAETVGIVERAALSERDTMLILNRNARDLFPALPGGSPRLLQTRLA